MFKQIVRVDPFGANADDPEAPNSTRSGNLAGPLLRGEPLILRYGAAIAIVLLAGGLRLALTPILGTQALLLPFVLAVLGTSILAGSGPALLASALAPILVTPLFTGWPVEAIAPAWWGHVVFFLVISAAVTHVMHSLQHATRVEQAGQVVVRQLEWEARQSEAQLRAMAEALPFLISYIDDRQRYRFANKEHRQWFGVEPGALIGRHAQHVWGDERYTTIRHQIEAALSGSAVDCEMELPWSSGCRQIRMHLRPDFGLDGTVRGLFATIEGLGSRSGKENPPGAAALSAVNGA
jgi:PAS domain S-box-containing protein